MQIVASVPGYEVIGIFRRCRECGQVKPLSHYLVYAGNGGRDSRKIKADVHLCAACRGKSIYRQR